MATISHDRGRTMIVPVIDRGPYIVPNVTHIAIGCTDLCTLSMRIGQ